MHLQLRVLLQVRLWLLVLLLLVLLFASEEPEERLLQKFMLLLLQLLQLFQCQVIHLVDLVWDQDMQDINFF